MSAFADSKARISLTKISNIIEFFPCLVGTKAPNLYLNVITEPIQPCFQFLSMVVMIGLKQGLLNTFVVRLLKFITELEQTHN